MYFKQRFVKKSLKSKKRIISGIYSPRYYAFYLIQFTKFATTIEFFIQLCQI